MVKGKKQKQNKKKSPLLALPKSRQHWVSISCIQLRPNIMTSPQFLYSLCHCGKECNVSNKYTHLQRRLLALIYYVIKKQGGSCVLFSIHEQKKKCFIITVLCTDKFNLMMYFDRINGLFTVYQVTHQYIYTETRVSSRWHDRIVYACTISATHSSTLSCVIVS